MLDFSTQKQILDPILKDPKNHNCADCDSISPTWASLDFGVFLCSNCSGAHRGLGPTITRVRSANLDKWQTEWMKNMVIGNSELNTFWESDPRAMQKKPNSNSSLQEISRYVFEKYVKRKFVKDRTQVDPLTRHKNGQSLTSKNNEVAPVQTPQVSKPVPKKTEQAPVISQTNTKKATDVCLLDFDEPQQEVKAQAKPQITQQIAPPQTATTNNQVNLFENEAFSTYSQNGSTGVSNDNNLISFDALLNQHKQPPSQPTQPTTQPMHHQPMHHQPNLNYNDLKAQNMQMHHPFNPQIAQHNMVYQNHFQQVNMHPQMHSQGYQVQPSNNGVFW